MKMEIEGEKVYVAIGTEGHDGFLTLQWALRKWGDHGIRVVILHAANSVCRDYVYTPLGKLPTSSVNEEKLQLLDRTEKVNTERVLAQYIAFCGRVKAEMIEMERKEQPLHKQMVDVISTLGISKLVMSLAFMKAAASSKSRSAISGTFYVARHKPEFCELFVICEGQRIFLREDENEEGLLQNDRGLMLSRLKDRNHSVRNWFGRMFPETSGCSSPGSSSGSPNWWEKYSQEMQRYTDELSSLVEGEMDRGNAVMRENSRELCIIPENMDGVERIQILGSRIQDAQETIQLNNKQANAAKERREKAERAINICNARAEELQTCLDKETLKKVELNRILDSTKEEIDELHSELLEKRSKLNTILQLQKELSHKLHHSSSSRARAELHLDKAVRTRADIVPEIEELRKQRDVLQRRIEFCKEKDAIVKVSKMDGFGFHFREFSAAEIIAATEDFSERLRLKSNVYRGRINHISVAVRVHDPADERPQEAFTTKVKLLSQIQHPNLLAMIGFCSQLSCIVYEYMHNGTLHDAIFPKGRSSKRKNRQLNWHARIRIAAEICSALGFLHNIKPDPIIHGNLKSSKVLLDRYNVAKIYGVKGPCSDDKHSNILDISALGNLVLQLLTGKNWDATKDGIAPAIENLDHTAGEWPTDLAIQLFDIAARCLSINSVAEESSKEMLVREINDVKRRADELVDRANLPVRDIEAARVEDLSNVPGAFLCPIYQDLMQNPHLAADGFSYELEAIDEWLKTGHDTSPMTNLRLNSKLLIPNHTLRSLIEDWRNNRSTASVPICIRNQARN